METVNKDFLFQAITTKFLCPTNTRPSRVKATAGAGSVTLSWDHGLNANENHERAAQAVIEKFNWNDNGAKLAGGQMVNGDYAWVMFNSRVQEAQS